MVGGILLAGASRGTGLEVARLLSSRGEAVTALVRPTASMTGLLQLPVKLFRGNILDSRSVQGAFASGAFRAVISTVGGKRGEPRPDHQGIRIIVDAAQKAGVRRCILVSAIGAGDSRSAVSAQVLEFLGEVLEEKTLGENYLRASGLDYTILRPGGMTHEPASGTALRTEDHGVMGTIHRQDLARLVLEVLDDPASIGRIFHVLDPHI